MAKKINVEEFEYRIKEIFNNTIDVSDFKFENTQIKGKCKCKICGNEWYARGYSLLAGHGCRKCYDKRNSENRKISLDEIQDVINKQGNDIKIIGEYIDTKHKCLARCNKCGNEWRTLPRYLMNGSDCPNCSKYSISERDLKEILVNKFGNNYSFENLDYKGISEKVNIRCNKHGYFKMNVRTLLQTNRQCICEECQKENKQLLEEEKKIKKQEILKSKIEKDTIIKSNKVDKTINFIEKCKALYKDHNYDYSKVEYNNKKVTIICPKHGEFTVNPYSFLKGHKCAKCAKRSYKYTTEEWIKIAKDKHPEFSYKNTIYVNKNKPLIVTCPVHDNVSVYPNTFLREEHPCPECKKDENRQLRSNKYWNLIEDFYKDKNYIILNRNDIIKNDSKIEVECNIHHIIFNPMVKNILTRKTLCPKCALINGSSKIRSNIEDVKERINKIHNNKYDLTLFTTYERTDDNIEVICPIHGRFVSTPHRLLSGQGCPDCGKIAAGIKGRLTQEEFNTKIQQVHLGSPYILDNIKYIKSDDYIEVYCTKRDKNTDNEHGFFRLKANAFLSGQGCPKCNASRLEQKIRSFLIKNKIVYREQQRFKWLINKETNVKLALDFYLPYYNIAIECQGEQHFVANFYKSKGIEYAEKHLEGVKHRDKVKKQLCKEHNIKLIYYLSDYFVKYLVDDDVYFTSEDDLINFIKKS